ncbi:hypothetical protein ETH_00011235 [Eimeria tenella]|uniref:Uncharacterized protein n=1 Tax=Eimeria tenella TaxID=5802 RepID=U6KVR8_EIMTE|nr:hypothetical protein ETH_00011235 [Eimeria tenella]CDJ42066.1 hypothetical protein ETH_00011235 [Eimeria tenella]|eukprot:XP_013232816.1 hypothetical protein ETH_00011235 [Eimeria tenella]
MRASDPKGPSRGAPQGVRTAHARPSRTPQKGPRASSTAPREAAAAAAATTPHPAAAGATTPRPAAAAAGATPRSVAAAAATPRPATAAATPRPASAAASAATPRPAATAAATARTAAAAGATKAQTEAAALRPAAAPGRAAVAAAATPAPPAAETAGTPAPPEAAAAAAPVAATPAPPAAVAAAAEAAATGDLEESEKENGFKVAVRIRPLNEKEKKEGGALCCSYDGKGGGVGICEWVFGFAAAKRPQQIYAKGLKGGAPHCLAADPGGPHVSVSSGDGILRLLDLRQNKKVLFAAEVQAGPATAICTVPQPYEGPPPLPTVALAGPQGPPCMHNYSTWGPLRGPPCSSLAALPRACMRMHTKDPPGFEGGPLVGGPQAPGEPPGDPPGDPRASGGPQGKTLVGSGSFLAGLCSEGEGAPVVWDLQQELGWGAPQAAAADCRSSSSSSTAAAEDAVAAAAPQGPKGTEGAGAPLTALAAWGPRGCFVSGDQFMRLAAVAAAAADSCVAAVTVVQLQLILQQLQQQQQQQRE